MAFFPSLIMYYLYQCTHQSIQNTDLLTLLNISGLIKYYSAIKLITRPLYKPTMIEIISDLTSIPLEETRVLLTLVCHIIASVFYKMLPVDKNGSNYENQIKVRELFGCVVGLISYFYLFPVSEMSIILVSNFVFYYLTRYCKDPKTTMTINFVNFSLLCGAHIHRTVFFYEDNIYNFNILLMMLVPKQIYFNWHIYGLNNKAAKEGSTDKIEYPSFYDYFCYNFNYIGNLTTPMYSYPEYANFIKQNYEDTKLNAKVLGQKLGFLLVSILLYVVIGQYHDYNLIDTKLFRQKNILYQVGYIVFQSLYIRSRYYIIWLIAEIEVVIANFKDSDNDYKDHISAVDIINVETTVSPKTRVASWNKSTAKFYRLCFYNPLVEHFKIDKSSASLFVFILSAFWHGFYPTYYLSFFFIYLATMTERIVFKNKDKLWFVPGFLYWLVFDLACISFKRHTFRATVEILKNTWIFVMLNPLVNLASRRYLRYLHRKQKVK